MNTFKNKDGKQILMAMVKGIQTNKEYLGEVDGLIGDGDHGMNMNKGFTLFENRFADKEFSFTEGLEELGTILFAEIGGSMGPIYGTILNDAASVGEDAEDIDVKVLAEMLRGGLAGLQEIVEAHIGDKTLVDTLEPAVKRTGCRGYIMLYYFDSNGRCYDRTAFIVKQCFCGKGNSYDKKYNGQSALYATAGLASGG